VSGARVRHHGDFDEAGVQILRDLEVRYGVLPWRFDLPALYQALRRRGVGVVHETRAVMTLEAAVVELTSFVAEELVIDGLLEDLRAAGPHRAEITRRS
jgi:hypothetical protein